MGGSVASLCEVYREVTRLDGAGHWVNLLFDHETDAIQVESPYTHPALRLRVKKAAPLFVRVPPWVAPTQIAITGVTTAPTITNGYLFIAEPPVNRWITVAFPLAEQTITLHHRTRDIRVQLVGDAVAAMENFGADLTFFEPMV
ncbi:MAG: hypothetical protein KF832_21900 [Caldilineaceae bacterium]|nr:hypothetical protein [Caldilineaceae bacterium]